MRRVLAVTLAVLALPACATIPTRARLSAPVAVRAPVRPVCESLPVNGAQVVTFMATDPAPYPCDVTGAQQLNIVFDDRYASDWGSDASVQRAAAECDQMGGNQYWTQEGGFHRLICRDVDT